MAYSPGRQSAKRVPLILSDWLLLLLFGVVCLWEWVGNREDGGAVCFLQIHYHLNA